MAFTVQTDQGDVDGANSYITEAFFRSYHTDRGNSLVDTSGVTYSAGKVQAACIQATDYLDQRFRYQGRKLNHNRQATEWPRFDVWDFADEAVLGLPEAVKEATAEYALRALTLGVLNPDIQRGDMGMPVSSVEQSLGPLSEKVSYDTKQGTTLPEYPAADAKLKRAGLVKQSMTRNLRRG